MPKLITHVDVCFSGHVQGVGFRYTALQVAREFELAGYVENLPDGRVHLEAEGEKTVVDKFLEALEERMHGFVKSVERAQSPRFGVFSDFIIR